MSGRRGSGTRPATGSILVGPSGQRVCVLVSSAYFGEQGAGRAGESSGRGESEGVGRQPHLAGNRSATGPDVRLSHLCSTRPLSAPLPPRPAHIPKPTPRPCSNAVNNYCAPRSNVSQSPPAVRILAQSKCRCLSGPVLGRRNCIPASCWEVVRDRDAAGGTPLDGCHDDPSLDTDRPGGPPLFRCRADPRAA